MRSGVESPRRSVAVAPRGSVAVAPSVQGVCITLSARPGVQRGGGVVGARAAVPTRPVLRVRPRTVAVSHGAAKVTQGQTRGHRRGEITVVLSVVRSKLL